MFSRVQLYLYVALAMGLMVTALAFSIDGDTDGAVMLMGLSAVMFVIAAVRERMDI